MVTQRWFSYTHMHSHSLIMTCKHLNVTAENFTVTPGLVIWAIVNSLLFVAILSGNTLTVLALRTCRRLRAIISNLFILSLALSDMIVGLSLPYHLAFYVAPTMLGQHKTTCLLRFFLIIFACCVSVFTLITIAADRYVAIVYPYQYCCKMTRRVAYGMIAFNWCAGVIIASIPMFFNQWSENCECEFYVILPPWYVVGIITPGFIIIWAVMFLLYWRILREALRCSQSIKQITYMDSSNDREKGATANDTNNNNTSNKKKKAKKKKKSNSAHISDWKSVQIVVLIMGCFSICWLPYFIVACDQIFNVSSSSSALYRSALTLAIANSCMNPIIYAWKNSNFSRAFRLLAHCQSPNTYADSVTYNVESQLPAQPHRQQTHKPSQQQQQIIHNKTRRATKVQIVTISHRHLNSLGMPIPLQEVEATMTLPMAAVTQTKTGAQNSTEIVLAPI